MRILLTNPLLKYDIDKKYEKYYIRSGSRWPHTGVKAKGTLPHYLPFPFFLAYGASLLREEGFEVYALDAVALDLSEEDFLKKIKIIKPHLIFYEVTTPTSNYDTVLVSKIKKTLPDIIISLGGTHATTFSQEILRGNSAVDFILKGEYEFSLLELAKAIRDNKQDFSAGIIYREKDRIIDNGHRPLIEPLDLLPSPARDIFPSNDHPDPLIYWDGFCQSYPAIQLHSSRGCPYRCYFCLWNQVIYNNGKYRTFSPKRVVDEMEDVVNKYGAKEIYFDDDDFIINKAHVYDICDEILRKRLKVKWSCMADTVNLNEEMLEKMAQSGCVGIKFGVESGSLKILKKLGKPVNLKNVKEVASLCARLRIKSHATFTVGLLEETEADVKKTIAFAQNLGVDSMQISIATPFPGTKFFDVVEQNGFLRSRDWKLYDGKTSEVVSCPSLNWKKIARIRKTGLTLWGLKILFSPVRLFRQFYIFFNTLRGLGFHRFTEKLISVVTDEIKNK